MNEGAISAILMKWRRLGAWKYFGEFAALEMIVGEPIVRAFKNAYRLYIRTGSKAALEDFNKIGDKLLESMMKLPEREREICKREYYKRQLAVTYRDKEGRQALQAIMEAVKSKWELSTLERTGNTLRLEEAEAIQAFASGWVDVMGAEGEYKKLFNQAFEAFSNRLPPDHPELREIIGNIVAHFKKHGKNLTIKESYLNTLQGALFEKYAANSRAWTKQVKKLFKDAEEEASMLGPNWEAERIVGDLKLYDKDAWDEIILIKNDKLGQGYLYSASQFKAEKRLTALEQTHQDAIWRESDALSPYAKNRSDMPNMLNIVKGNDTRAYQLIPKLGDSPTFRYVVHTKGTKIPSNDQLELIRDGLQVDMLELDLTAKHMRAIADAFYESVAKVLSVG